MKPLVLLLATMTVAAAHAQAPDARRTEWYQAGIQVSPDGGTSVNGSYSFQQRGTPNAYRIAYEHAVPILINRNADEFPFIENAETYSIRSLSASLGRQYSHRFGQVALFVGPSVGWHRHTRREEEDQEEVLRNQLVSGLTTNVQLFARPLRRAGLGVELFSNLNPKRSTYGVRLAVQASRLVH